MENFMCCIRRRILPNLIHKIPSQVGIPVVVGGWPGHPHTCFMKLWITPSIFGTF
jgi:hypothetical protein